MSPGTAIFFTVPGAIFILFLLTRPRYCGFPYCQSLSMVALNSQTICCGLPSAKHNGNGKAIVTGNDSRSDASQREYNDFLGCWKYWGVHPDLPLHQSMGCWFCKKMHPSWLLIMTLGCWFSLKCIPTDF